MNAQYMTSSELKSQAKNLLEGRYGYAMLILFLGNMVTMALSMAVNSVLGVSQVILTLSPLPRMLISLLSHSGISLFTNILSAGYALFFLNMACRRSYDIGNLFYGYKWQFRKCLSLSGVFVLVNLVTLLPYNICFGMFLQTRSTGWLMGALLASSAAMIISTLFLLVFSQCYYLMLDFPQNPGGKTLSLCWRMMKGHKRRLFRLELSFLPLMLLCVLSFGIGFLWLNPYMQMTYTCFFLDLMNPRDTETP